MTAMPSIAIIGAGLTGLACARVLAERGVSSEIFDKARGPGGRLTSRRLPGAVVDLGAQYFTAREPRFAARVDAWRQAGLVAPWPTRLWRVEAKGWQPHRDDQTRYSAVPRMSALTRALAEGLTLHVQTRITALEQQADGWWLADDQGQEHGPYARVVITVPTPQAEPLVAPHDAALAADCRAVTQRPCWAGHALFEAPLPPPPGVDDDWQAAFVNSGPLSLVSRNDSKPGRTGQGESLTLLAGPAASADWLEDDAETVAPRLLSAFETLYGRPLPRPRLLGAHRWRYAQPAGQVSGPGYRLSAQGLALAGDGFRASRVEDAWLSGHDLGQALAAELGH
ncbi:FAD-dependent oxidoreductase [Halomonas sp. YLGW01]|uniref:NAD(P)/FAD-dependent oxidoreductase n=1 Tax=Halomonas sp. YLGW01 TaxID=2773308 RepID=UPI001787053B|nr:FAD-dependent oxidoreductase [Halomonas sp. YLGW01]